ncbi:hypothetical protein ABPG72_012044 [Tetrahymena utriculariae]
MKTLSRNNSEKRKRDSESDQKAGVIRINEALIKQVTNQSDFSQIKALNFHIRLNNNSKIQRLEGLDDLVNLQELNLSYNSIQKIENLARLQNLRELNLAENNLSRLEGLEVLKNLENINLNGNSIVELPVDILKNLQKLRVLKLTRNKVKELGQVQNLSVLSSLESLSISENPFCKSITYQEFCIYTMTGLKVLDSKKVDEDQRKNALFLFSSGLQNKQGKNQGNNPQSSARDDISMIKKQIEQANQQRDQLSYENQYLKEERDSLNQQIESLNERFQIKLKENSAFSERLAKLEAELQNYKIDDMFQSFKDTRNFDLNKLMDFQNTQNLVEFDNQYFNKLEQKSKDLHEKREEYLFKIENLEAQCDRLKERIIEREKEMNQAAESYFQMKNQIRMNSNIKFMKDSFMPDSDDLEILIKQKEAKLAFHYNENEKLRFANNELQREIDLTRDKIDKTRILINKLDAINDGESTSSEVEDERVLLDKKINSLYQKLTSQQEKNNEIIHLITSINNEVNFLSQEIEDLKKQRQESYLKPQKTVKTNESESVGLDNEKLKELSNNITFFQNEINLMNEKLEDNQKVLKEFHILLQKNQSEIDILESQKQQIQNNFKASTFVNNLSNSFKKTVQNQLTNAANNLSNIVHVLKTKAPKVLNKKLSVINKIEQQANSVTADPQIDNFSQCLADLSGAIRFIFEEMDDYKIEQGVIFDEQTNQKRKEFYHLQQQIDDFQQEKQRCFDQINILYKEYIYDQVNNAAKKKKYKSGQDEYNFPEKFESFEDMQQVFKIIQKLMKNVEKNELTIKNFNEVKQKFLDEFEKETQELSQKWREFESKKSEHKSKINKEREQLYQQLEQEYEKVKQEREAIKNDRQRFYEEQENYFLSQQKNKEKEENDKFTIIKDAEDQRQLKQNLEMEIYQLKSHLTRLQSASDEAEAKRSVAEKDLQRILQQIQKETEKVFSQNESKEKQHKIQQVFEESIKKLNLENERLQNINSQLSAQKQELQSEVQKFEVDMKIIIQKFEGEETIYKQKLKELESTIQEKRKILYSIEQTLNDKEININRVDSLLEEYENTKEKYKQIKMESLNLEKQIEEGKIKADENEMKIKMQQNQLSSLKKHLESLSSLSKQKQQEVISLEKQYNDIQQQSLDAELKIQKLEGQQQYYIEEMNKIEKSRTEKRKDLQILEKQVHDKDLELQSISLKLEHVKQEYEVKQKELKEIRQTYQLDEKKFKSLMEENHKTLQQLRETIEEREQQYYSLSKKREQLENTEKQKQDNLQNLINSSNEKEHQLNILNQQVESMSEEQNLLANRLQELSNIQSKLIDENTSLEERRQELNDQVNDLEQYAEELKDEQKDILERIKTLTKKEETIYINKAFSGEELDKNVQLKIEQIIESYYANQNKDEEIEQLNKQIKQLKLESENYKNILNSKNNQIISQSQQKAQLNSKNVNYQNNLNSTGKLGLGQSSSLKNMTKQNQFSTQNQENEIQSNSKFQLDTFANKNGFMGLNTLASNNMMMIQNDNESLLLSSDNKYKNLVTSIQQKNNQDLLNELNSWRLKQIKNEQQDNPFLRKLQQQLELEATPAKQKSQDNILEDNLFSSNNNPGYSASKASQNNSFKKPISTISQKELQQQEQANVNKSPYYKNQEQNQNQRSDDSSNQKQKHQSPMDKIYQELEEADRQLLQLQDQNEIKNLMESSQSEDSYIKRQNQQYQGEQQEDEQDQEQQEQQDYDFLGEKDFQDGFQ